MALDMTPEQKATGKANFEQVVGDLAREGKMTSAVAGSANDPKKPAADPKKEPTRRDALKVGLAVGAVVPVSAAIYFGYDSWRGNDAVRTALIGCGDEGGVLVGDHNPEFNKIVAVCDIRPTNLDRIFEGEKAGPRKGLNTLYGKDTAARDIKRYDSLDALLNDKKKLELEAVIIATPLNTHDVIAKKCMDAGLHVLCEKLMARTITKCKEMIRYARDKGLVLSIGHQRHYSTLYAQALEVIQAGVLGDIKHIRAQWPRNNSWPFSATGEERSKFATGMDIDGKPFDLPFYRDGWCKPVLKADAEFLMKDPAKLREWGYDSVQQLVRWRLFDKTGGGLMAELGSHQLDASSIVLGHVHPLAVSGVGGKFFYGPGRNDRESDDGIFVNFEFPGKNHPKAGFGGNDKDDIVVVTYTSFNTNSFEKYGECVCGSRGTMVIEEEREVYLYKEPEPGKAGSGGRDTKVTVTAGGTGPAMASTSTWGGASGATVTKTASGGPVWDSAVRGYRTEMEHFAYCIRMWQKMMQPVSYEKDGPHHLKHAAILPRCHGEVAMADAIIALTANMAMARKERIVFEKEWFDADLDAVPETKYGGRKA